mgnify:CR=1 FL=1
MPDPMLCNRGMPHVARASDTRLKAAKTGRGVALRSLGAVLAMPMIIGD